MDIQALSTTMILYGVEHGMEDIYILPYEKEYVVSYRKGEQRILYDQFPNTIGQQLITRFKYLGEMNVGEKRKAQMGAIRYILTDATVRLRLSSVGDYQHRESMVIRYLHPLVEDKLNFFLDKDVPLLVTQTQRRGLYLFSGPVGSGKTSLMYYLAMEMKRQVITIEDPVEIEKESFLQLQVNEQIKQTYEQLIKLSLRHRPDILIIGEIRDETTAKAAVRASLAGHCVYATIHASSVSGARNRLLELSGYMQMIDECLQGVIYQEFRTNREQCSTVLWAFEFYMRGQEVEKRNWDQTLNEWMHGVDE